MLLYDDLVPWYDLVDPHLDHAGAFACALVEPSAPMRARSHALNPECEHLEGDMRTVRLGRTFDAVLVHDAIMYMTTEDDLRAAAETVFVHLRPGGAEGVRARLHA